MNVALRFVFDFDGINMIPGLIRPASPEMERLAQKKEDVMRLVEAQIAGNVDLSPEEMVEAAFLMVHKINRLIYGQAN